MRPPRIFTMKNWAQGVGDSRPPIPANITVFYQETEANLRQGSRSNRSHHRCVLIFNFETEYYICRSDNCTSKSDFVLRFAEYYSYDSSSGLLQSFESNKNWIRSQINQNTAEFDIVDQGFEVFRMELSTGESYQYKFNEKGEWSFHDHLSPDYGGVIVVK